MSTRAYPLLAAFASSWAFAGPVVPASAQLAGENGGAGDQGSPTRQSEEPSPALPRLGPNLARGCAASAFSWGADATPGEAGLAVDGDSATAWSAVGPGPASWQVDFGGPRRVGLLAIAWTEALSGSVLLESPGENESVWRELARWNPSREGKTLSLVSLGGEEVSRLRLSVESTGPGERVGIRELGVYASPSDLPSALARRMPPVRERAVAEAGSSAERGIPPGWKQVASAELRERGWVGQIVPTASGGLFVSVFPETGPGRVLRLESRAQGGELEAVAYLSGLAPGTRIAWDGEWLLTLSGGRLERVRRALGFGPADERGAGTVVFATEESDGKAASDIADLRLGEDGWLHALVRAPGGAVLLDRSGRALALEGASLLRFRLDGAGLSARRLGPEDALRLEPRGFGAWEPRPLPYPEGADRFVPAEALVAGEPDGERLWLVSNSPEGLRCLCFVEEGGADEGLPSWDDTPFSELFGWVEKSGRPSVRREGAREILRRKGDALPELSRRLEGELAPGAAEAFVGVVGSLPEALSRPWLGRLARDGEDGPKAAALLALADFGDSGNHPAFAELGRTTTPSVTAAAFRAILRSGSRLEGDEEIALALLTHPDEDLARTAKSFLLERKAIGKVFSAWSGSEEAEAGRAQFDFLVEISPEELLRRLLERLGRTGDPAVRREALGALCRLHAGARLSESSMGEIEEALLSALTDHRVNRLALLRSMVEAGLPLPPGESLVDLAREEPSLEAFVLGELRRQGGSGEAGTQEWLRTLAGGESRDDEMRLAAAKLLGLPPPVADSASAAAGPIEAEAAEGRRLLAKASCLDCHGAETSASRILPNLTELSAAVARMDDASLERRLRKPPAADGRNLSLVEFVDTAGRRLFGTVEARDSDGVRLRDRAGNLFLLEAGEIDREVGHYGPYARCHEAAALGEDGLRRLLAYLRQSTDE